MKYLFALLLTFVTVQAYSLDLSIDQVNIGLVGEYEKANADNYPVAGIIQQNGVELYVKTTIGKVKANFSCTIGVGREYMEAFGTGNTLEGEYFNCQYYAGFYEWKR